MAMREPPRTHVGAASYAIVQTDLQAQAMHTIMEREGASAARVIVERSRWHKPFERVLEIELYYTAQRRWDEDTRYFIRASGSWCHGGVQGVWRDP